MFKNRCKGNLNLSSRYIFIYFLNENRLKFTFQLHLVSYSHNYSHYHINIKNGIMTTHNHQALKKTNLI